MVCRVDAGEKPGFPMADREKIKALRKELAEVKRANKILKTARRVSRPWNSTAD